MRRGGIAAKTKIRRTASTHQGPSEWRVQVGQRVSDPNELGPECFCDGLKPVEQASPQNVWLSMSQRFGCRTDWPGPIGRLDVAINVGRAQADFGHDQHEVQGPPCLPAPRLARPVRDRSPRVRAGRRPHRCQFPPPPRQAPGRSSPGPRSGQAPPGSPPRRSNRPPAPLEPGSPS